MGKKIIFVDLEQARKNHFNVEYDERSNAFYIDYWKTDSIRSKLCYFVDDTVIFLKHSINHILVRSKKYSRYSMNLRAKAQQECSEGLLYPYISEVFKIFDNINTWMLEFDLDDTQMSAIFRVALTHLFVAFALGAPASDAAINELYYGYHQSALYNMMVKNLKPDDMLGSELFALLKRKKEPFQTIYRTQKIDRDWPKSSLTKEDKAHYDKMYITACRGNGKTALAQRIMRDAIFGINGGLNMDNLYNFRKNIKEIRRDKKNPGKFLIDSKDGFLSREIVCDGFSKEELYSEEFIETILVIATQIQYDGITKVIFNKEEKMTIIFPHNSYKFSERIIVKANGLDAFDILNGYSIAKAKMLCSGDGYQWYNKLRKSGKVDV